ncbi:MAG: hypothetical protein ACRDH8_08510 [Actinomycetota bacterium]
MSDLPLIGGLAIVLLVAVMLWFALGTQRNIRRGNALLRWLQGGLPLLGSRTTFRWLGSTAVVLKIPQAQGPFREAEVVVVLEPRDVALLWAWSRRRGRRDFLILRGWLQRAPRLEVEAGDDRGWTGGDRLKRLDLETWRDASWGDEHVRMLTSRDAEAGLGRRAWDALEEASGGVWRLSIRREHPHLEAHVRPPEDSVSAERLFRAFREVGEKVTRTK